MSSWTLVILDTIHLYDVPYANWRVGDQMAVVTALASTLGVSPATIYVLATASNPANNGTDVGIEILFPAAAEQNTAYLNILALFPAASGSPFIQQLQALGTSSVTRATDPPIKGNTATGGYGAHTL